MMECERARGRACSIFPEFAHAWPTVCRSVAHPAENMGGVRRAVVKIYHGRDIDHRRDMWRSAHEKTDKSHPERA
jgi:hypothetical protein